MAAFGASTAIEGGSGFYNHFVNGNNNSYNPLKVGFSQLPGGYGPLIYSGTDLILSIGAGFVKVPLKMGLADGLNRPKTMFNVTVRNADNNYFVPMTGIPTPYGTAMMMYFRSVGDKAFTVYEEASSERK
ncbi:hypothetical protein C4C32_03760 [Pseudomonas corrugata]|uniref:Uncharacterized protein n=1 Tax=Pseudomonas corrugata TaxID=47879 RepID=A0A8B6UT08_9PSED|nr:hypothetical protein [Pseudomonas corrugata]QTH15035.1 hypothetical protein C4C32_03760 [Pseudomonas corrugata]